ncbi:MAG: site-2 protease family protein [Candidatus Wildermuthbacteria bacterium]|nr:site-2 protease family protein [Candidatus Wildermuthbacteria bacterium]
MELIVFQIAILIFSVVVHEVSHGAVAQALGDPTAKNAGRLTLNPIPHIDPLGSVIFPLLLFITTQGQFMFGWAKPVPINPFNFRDRKWGALKVGLAGPAANIAMALAFALVLRFLPFELYPSSAFPLLLSYVVMLNILLGVFNLLPIPPLDGSHVLFTFLPRAFDSFKIMLTQYGFIILVFVIFFFSEVISDIVRSVFLLLVG